ncbi:MAG TPA: hypothetical protein VMV01_10650, partial [Planctomycetota bacterium]|nr:hypothetical protein [Planctomycetota bacterium]
LPLSPALRARLRRLAESLGQRGGQVAGSFLLLGALALGATPRAFAIAVAVLCGAWLLGYLRLQAEYVDRFRTQLSSLSASGDSTVPDLDLQALETLVATLGAANDAEVIAALDLLESYGRLHLVSPLILYHPAPKVVLHALDLFERNERDDVQAIRRRLLEHSEPFVRATALRQFTARARDRGVVRTMLSSDPSPLVRRTALVLWLGFGEDTAGALEEAVAAVVAFPDTESRVAMASALTELPAPLLLPVTRALLVDPRSAVRRQVARSLATDPDAPRIPLLTELVAFPECRGYAREGLLTLGEPALEHAATVLQDARASATLRRHLPRTISRFCSARAAEILVAQLGRERDERVVYKILRGLGRLRTDNPSLPVDRPALVAAAERMLERTVELLAFRVATDLLQQAGAGSPDLLPALLEELEQRSLERIFRLLQILETSEDFATMFAALSVDSQAARAGARELLEHVVEGRFRDVLLALTDSLPPADRLRAAAATVPVAAADQTLAASSLSPGDRAALIQALAGVMHAMQGDHNPLLAGIVGRQPPAQSAGPNLVEAPRAAS